jgi:hypothetical protein
MNAQEASGSVQRAMPGWPHGPLDSAGHVEANGEAEAQDEEEGESRQEAELRPRLTPDP